MAGGYEVHMKFRPRPYLEVGLQMDSVVIDGDGPAAIVNWVRRIGMNKHSGGDNLFLVSVDHLFHCDWGRENERIEENA